MKNFFKAREEINELMEVKSMGMTKKAHAEITRQLKQKVADLEDKRNKAIEAHGSAMRELEAHRMKDPSYVKKKEARDQKAFADYKEPGRSRDSGHSGWTGNE